MGTLLVQMANRHIKAKCVCSWEQKKKSQLKMEANVGEKTAKTKSINFYVQRALFPALSLSLSHSSLVFYARRGDANAIGQ